jgi:dsRNA-specific ribonuclease
MFYVTATWDNGNAHGQGNSIKSAEMMAASEALKMLDKPKKPAAKRAGKK